ncbi:MAG: putative LPS assembly protein LptD, partial [candidate division Zixibacteria bacterium]
MISEDTISVRSAKKFTKVNHGVQVSSPIKLFSYINLNPSFSYNETWFKVHPTDQSKAKDIDAKTTYRTYSYSFGSSIRTSIFGTVYPKILGLAGLRQVITPSISYRLVPVSNRHPEVRSFAGGGAGNTTRSARMTVSLDHEYQAKIGQDEAGRNLNLVSFSHGFSYNFENDERPYSGLSTTF